MEEIQLTAKQAAIKAAYGEHWDKVKEHVDENGGCYSSKISPNQAGVNEDKFEIDWYPWNYWAPRLIRGISHNNGWTRCDERMPGKEVKQIHYCIEGKYGGKMPAADLAYSIQKMGAETFTHWKPYIPEPNPIY